MNLGSGVALAAASVNLSVTIFHFVLARVPGWRIARLFACMALVAASYNALSAVLFAGGLSEDGYLRIGQVLCLLLTANAALWLFHAYTDSDGSLRAVPSIVRWVAGVVAVAGLCFAITGALLQRPVGHVDVAWPQLRYSAPTTAQTVYALFLTGIGAVAAGKLFRRYRSGEHTLRWELSSYSLFVLCAIGEVWAANRTRPNPLLLNIAFALPVLAFSQRTIQRLRQVAGKVRDSANGLEMAALPIGEKDRKPDAPATEQDVRTLVESLDAIVWEADAESLSISFVSQGAERLLGYPPGAASNMSAFWSRFLHPEDRDLVQAAAREALRTGQGTSLEYRVLTADGRLRWFRDSLQPVAHGPDMPGRLRGVIVDVTESRHAQDALVESEERFRTLFENATIGIYRTTPDGRILMVNPALLTLLGYQSLEELYRRNLEQEGFEPSYPRSDFRRRLAEDGTVRGMEAAWTRRDGSVVFVRESARAVRAADGSILYYDGVVEDITESRRAHEALLESEERFRIIFQHAAVGAALVDIDEKLLVVNDRYCEIVQRPREELIGRTLRETTYPDDQPVLEEEIRQLLNGTIPTFSIENRYLSSDGSAIWGRLFASLVCDREGKPKHFIAVLEDITEGKRAQAALMESERRFREMADSAPAMIWTSDRAGRATFFNKQALIFSGRAMEQLTGRGWVDFVHPDDLDHLLSSLTAMLKEPGGGEVEFRVRRSDGTYRWLLALAIPRFDGADYVGQIGINVDITELKRNHEQIAASQKLESLGVLAGGIAHDFNNLLGSILAESELILDQLPQSSTEQESIERIQKVARCASEIVRQMMAYAGQETADREPVDLSALIRELLGLLKISVSKRAVLTAELANGLPSVRANAAEVRQVVLNLITNASEALEDREGTIRVSTSQVRIDEDPSLPAGEYVRLEVSDTGCGMTPDVQSRIFDPFFTTKFAGRGLGLAAAQGIIRSHGGSIRFESAAGAGTRFEVLLPCTAEPARLQEKDTRRPRAPANPLYATVLIVEDEDTLRSAVTKMLKKRGFTVIEAADGRTALDLMSSNRSAIGLVLLDMTLPGMNGGEVFRHLRDSYPDVKVILTTAYSQEVALMAVGNSRPWGFIRKPYQIAELEDLFRAALSASGGTHPSPLEAGAN